MPPPVTTPAGEQYSSWMGLIYVFNLIVGTGALTLPAAFASAGWLLSSIGLIMLASFSYITAGWVVEAMACANAIKHWRRVKQLKKRGLVTDELVNRTLENAAESDSNNHSFRSSIVSQSGSAGSIGSKIASVHSGGGSCGSVTADKHQASTSSGGVGISTAASAAVTGGIGVVGGSTSAGGNQGCLNNISSSNYSDALSSEDHEDQEETLLIQEVVIERTMGEYYAIQERVEMGEMAKLFFGKVWVKLFFVVLCLYLYGDLAIYEAAVAKSLRDIVCTYVPKNCSQILREHDPCFPHSDYSRLDIYRICVCSFVGLMGPFVFINLTKTKYMQILTTITRWIALVVMIAWAVVVLANGTAHGSPPVAQWKKLPDLFGVCVYSFMCHHSLPSLITPISNKSSIFKLLAADYLLILMFYLLLAFTGIFAFSHLEDLYTLNFMPDPCRQGQPLTFIYCVQIYLMLFPVFTLSTNFPIIAITLRNNLKGLMLRETRRYSFFTTRLLFPLLAIIPPTIIGLVTSNVEFLVGITGAYAGSIIQYVVPATLVYNARRMTLQRIGMGVRNPFISPVKANWCLYLIGSWAVVCWVFVSVYLLQPDTAET
uniref:Transmembrane protein 104-like n=1 Tax=Hirondellea gigas TaxID=1518452 RepID=A0A2P2I805_9CRUS